MLRQAKLYGKIKKYSARSAANKARRQALPAAGTTVCCTRRKRGSGIFKRNLDKNVLHYISYII